MSPIESIYPYLIYFIQSKNLCLLIILFSPLILNVITTIVGSISAISFFVYYMCHVFLLLDSLLLTPFVFSQCILVYYCNSFDVFSIIFLVISVQVPYFFRSKLSATPYLYLVNFLEWFTKLRETLLTRSPVIITGYNSGTARWKRYIENGMKKGLRASMLSEHATLPESPHTHQLRSS